MWRRYNGNHFLERGRMRETQEAEVVSDGVMKVEGEVGGWGSCHREADVSTSQLTNQWDAVNQQSDPYTLTSPWTAEGRAARLHVRLGGEFRARLG